MMRRKNTKKQIEKIKGKNKKIQFRTMKKTKEFKTFQKKSWQNWKR